ncbi:MAG: Hsp20/alpha crystallin family protein [Verrucomicrobiae bacterium]|nr:Hsp20/alpha crystallin family protein [Verrucomicrobiae bacterium]MDW8309595.1 Hsp20/alpha crystallin family protein [Verrucomicrobiales bacterium]
MSEFFQIRFEHWPGGGSTQITRIQRVRPGGAPCWAPAVNVYRCGNRFVVCMDLAGVQAREISVQAQPRRLRIAGHRAPPEPQDAGTEPLQVLAMEIDYGRFEREIILPAEIDPARTTAEQRDGWLWIHLPLKV